MYSETAKPAVNMLEQHRSLSFRLCVSPIRAAGAPPPPHPRVHTFTHWGALLEAGASFQGLEAGTVACFLRQLLGRTIGLLKSQMVKSGHSVQTSMNPFFGGGEGSSSACCARTASSSPHSFLSPPVLPWPDSELPINPAAWLKKSKSAFCLQDVLFY